MTQATSQQASRETLATRVRKLQKMTTQAGCSESEAAFAASRIAAIMAEHALTQDELSLKEDAAHCIKDEFIFWGSDFGDWRGLQGSIARLFGVKTWAGLSREEDELGLGFTTRVKPFVFFGLANDVTAAIATMSICFSAVATTAERERRKRQDFAAGMIARLAKRIDELRPKVQTGTALIVLKAQLVNAEFAKLGLRLVSARGSRTVDPAAFARGFAAGAHVNIHGGRNATGSTPAPRQIGGG
jgi:hypothetical protein